MREGEDGDANCCCYKACVLEMGMEMSYMVGKKMHDRLRVRICACFRKQQLPNLQRYTPSLLSSLPSVSHVVGVLLLLVSV